MREQLETWANDADALQYIDMFRLASVPAALGYVRDREDDYFISLVGELFARLRHPYDDLSEWSRLGNALTQAVLDESGSQEPARTRLPRDTALFAASAFYLGGIRPRHT